MRLLRAREFVRLGENARGAVVEQLIAQHSALQSLRLRRQGLLDAFKHAAADNASSRSKSALSNAFYHFVSDGKQWEGKPLPFGFSKEVNLIATHTVHALMCLDLVNGEEKPCESSEEIGNLCRFVIEDLGALSREKFSVCPPVHVSGELHVKYPMYLSLLQFILAEVLKNSIQAVIERYGTLDAEDAPPIELRLEQSRITVLDFGKGMNQDVAARAFDAFFTSHAPREAGYGYSRNFGVAFSGEGFGLLKSRVYAEFHDGGVSMRSQSGVGTTVEIDLGK